MAETRKGTRDVAYMLVLNLVEDHAENILVARRVAAKMIKTDKERPELEENPFKRDSANA